MSENTEEHEDPRVFVGVDSALAQRMGLCKGGEGFWCGALINNGVAHKPGCPAARAEAGGDRG